MTDDGAEEEAVNWTDNLEPQRGTSLAVLQPVPVGEGAVMETTRVTPGQQSANIWTGYWTTRDSLY